jgi:hypothetical protein
MQMLCQLFRCKQVDAECFPAAAGFDMSYASKDLFDTESCDIDCRDTSGLESQQK